MKWLYYSINGDEKIVSESSMPILDIVWGRAFDDIYCHHATFCLPKVADSLFQPELAKVTVGVRQNMIEGGEVKSYSDSHVVRFFPVTNNQDYLHVPILHNAIIDALCENGWTSLKDGKRGTPKSFPTRIEIVLNGQHTFEFVFLHENGKYPFTISEKAIEGLKNGEKIRTSILLK